ncbi:binding-protein-dependent transport system inner membrane protein [Agrilactobacillus composti DSM 18527 = JCM 14202]|uniref:Binding-protein-dependent transport system inner membrane protein n=1 Tax=Agrilactobacillus composti DSM 18527 = JCM 14202 TaxID=1423734 RepID=X0PMX3_9LACO|nr:binding-protein-dependent transport system inner membrane protein [Agrilactobacillus composti DSM 18527 = JCM 14202]GAF38236.1 ABC transporter, permease protein [Agrilactobacillus composti DSM 18527 = JCM 14202]
MKTVSILKKVQRQFVPQKSISKRSAFLMGVLAFVFLILAWSVVTYTGIVDPLFAPSPSATLQEAVRMMTSGFWTDIGVTVMRVMLGFAVALLVALPIGIFVGAYAPVAAFFEPVFSFVRYMPASAFIPLFIFWIGIGEKEKIAIIILGSLPQLILMIANNIRNVESSLIEVSYTLGTTPINVLWKVILPKSIPDIMNTIRIVLGWAWTYVIVAEMVGASSGIGYTILQAQRTMKVDSIFVGILILGLIGLICDSVLIMLNKRLFPWSTNER